MRIINLHIEDFGCFSNRDFEFCRGVNLVTGENESGKSTLISFIKFILYGMPKKSAENAAFRARSISWQTGTAAGSMTLEKNGRTYTVSRRGVLHKTEKRESYSEDSSIIDCETGLEIHKNAVPGEVFLGVPLTVFESTCFVRQLGSGDIDTADLSRSLENMLVSADESLNLKKALDKLDSARKLFRHKTGKGGSINELEAEEASLKTRLSRAMDDYNKILARTDAVGEIKNTITEKRAELDRLEDMSIALGMVNVVKRFDLLHSTEDELGAARGELEDYKSTCVASFGAMPSESHSSALGEANAAQKNAQDRFDAAQENYENTKNAAQKFEREYLGSFNENVRRVTDQKAVCDKIKDNLAATEKGRKKAKLSFALSVILAIASAVSFFLILPLGIALATLCIGAVVCGFIMLRTAKSVSRNLDLTFSDFGISDACGTHAERLDELRVTFKRYSEGLSRLSEHERAVSIAESAKDMRRADLTTCIAATNELMSKWNGGESTPDAAIEKAKEIIARTATLEGEVRRLSFAVSALSAELSEYDEADVRARVPRHIVDKFTPKDIERAENEKRFVSMSLKQLTDKSLSLERELLMLEKETENPNRLATELESVIARREKETFTFDALVLAQESLTLASSNIRSTVTPVIKDRASEFMAVLTGDKYSSMGIDDDYNMFALSDAASRPVAHLSAGTQDLAYLSLRMALLSLFYKDELPPLALDDALTQLDDKRVKNALRLLAAYAQKDGQSILFSCHSREKELLFDVAEANVVSL